MAYKQACSDAFVEMARSCALFPTKASLHTCLQTTNSFYNPKLLGRPYSHCLKLTIPIHFNLLKYNKKHTHNQGKK